MTAPAAVGDVFRDHDDFWVEAFRRLVGPGAARLLHIKHVPVDLSVN